MDFFYYLLYLLYWFFDSSWMKYYFYPFIALAFIASVPRLIRLFVTWR